MHDMDWFAGNWFMMAFWWILIIALIAFAIKWIIGQRPQDKETALDILKKRYANGEINKEEFKQKKKDLL